MMRVKNIGWSIMDKTERPPLALVDQFALVATEDIADVVTRMYAMDSNIQTMYRPTKRIAGSAVTVRVPPGDNLMVHVALAHAGEGDVLVVDGRGDTNYALCGGLMCAIAQKTGVRGFVLDGVYRDAAEIHQMDFPVFARGIMPKAGRKDGPGEINTVVACGGVPVRPGDIVVADDGGVVVVPKDYAETVLAAVVERAAYDASRWADTDTWRHEHRQTYKKRLEQLGYHG